VRQRHTKQPPRAHGQRTHDSRLISVKHERIIGKFDTDQTAAKYARILSVSVRDKQYVFSSYDRDLIVETPTRLTPTQWGHLYYVIMGMHYVLGGLLDPSRDI